MKRFISLFLVAVLLVLPLSAVASAAEVDAEEAATANVQPRLTGTRTLSLGNAWTDVVSDNNWLSAYVTVTNAASSSYDVQVRIVDAYGVIIVSGKTISAGSSKTFGPIAYDAGKYTIQAKSADNAVREYTLHYHD